jgi:hypothetical protein
MACVSARTVHTQSRKVLYTATQEEMFTVFCMPILEFGPSTHIGNTSIHT